MDYITIEQFMEQPEKVKKAIKKFLYGEKNRFPDKISETELRRFIEEKTGGHIEWLYYTSCSEKGYIGYTMKIITHEKDCSNYFYQDLGHDLLQAYWKSACIIANI